MDIKKGIEPLSIAQLDALIRSLLDAASLEHYGKDDAMTMAMSALGISTSSAIDLDSNGKVVYQFGPAEVGQRIDFVTRTKAEKKLPFFEAVRLYFQANPQPDPLAQFRNSLKRKTSPKRRSPGR